jgi:hypothetical protein
MMSPDEEQAVAPYLTLLESFASDQLAAPVFEQQFLERYQADPFLWSEPVFGILDRVFADVDAYVADEDLRDPDDGDLDDEGLRASARAALEQLSEL